jgi:hypothetical protein
MIMKKKADEIREEAGEVMVSEVPVEPLREIVAAIEELNATQAANQKQAGQFLGELDTDQQRNLDDLGRLYDTLGRRGPEQMLDTVGYSRPVPPRKGTRKALNGD